MSALGVNFTTVKSHIGDTLSCVVGKNTVAGVLTASPAKASKWKDTNYTVDDRVVYNGRVYSCTSNTVSKEIPTDLAHWTQGYVLSVSSTVASSAFVGIGVRLSDLSSVESVGRVIRVDSSAQKIWVSGKPVSLFSAASPTYVQFSIFLMDKYPLSQPSTHDVGGTKIGGSHVPANTPVTFSYTNKHATQSKRFFGYIDFLY